MLQAFHVSTFFYEEFIGSFLGFVINFKWLGDTFCGMIGVSLNLWYSSQKLFFNLLPYLIIFCLVPCFRKFFYVFKRIFVDVVALDKKPDNLDHLLNHNSLPLLLPQQITTLVGGGGRGTTHDCSYLPLRPLPVYLCESSRWWKYGGVHSGCLFLDDNFTAQLMNEQLF